MVRVLCIVPLALAAASAVSGHVIRQHKTPPSGWETSILQNYDVYHTRYLEWNCQKQHNTTFFDKCCHPLLSGEPISVLENLGCNAADDECDDGDSSVPPPSSTQSGPSQPAHAATSPSPPPSSSSKPANAALAKGNETPTPTPSSSFPPKSSTSPPPAQTSSGKGSGSGSGSGGDVHKGGQATFFLQNGVAGACGKVHQDSDFICAIDSALFNQNICGKSVRVTNTDNGQSVTVTVADECPTCSGPDSIDFSTGAFGGLGDKAKGVLPIEWEFV